MCQFAERNAEPIIAGAPAVIAAGVVCPRSTYKSRLRVLSWKGGITLAVMVSLIVLGWFSLYLAAMRIYQVDECMEIYVARVLGSAQDHAMAGSVTLFQVLLSWLLPHARSSVDLFAAGRLVMVVLFWSNWLLMAMATGERLFSFHWLIALAGAATLAPLWDYGFEIRHDNLMLTGLLLLWSTVRFQPARLWSYALVGLISAGLEFVAFKTFIYTLPLSLAILVFPPPGRCVPRWKLALAWLAGAVAALLFIRIAFGVAGLWELYLAGFKFLAAASEHGHRFGPGLALGRLLRQTPLLLALLVAAFASLVQELRRCGRAAWSWEGSLPEALLCLGAFVALLLNPAPFPYDLLHLVPFVFLFAYRYGKSLCQSIGGLSTLYPAAGMILVFTHVVPFGRATERLLDWPNTRQEHLTRLAEDLTDPVKDPVYDAIAMVPTRPIVDPRAFLHSLNIESLIHGPGPKVRDLLAARPAAVVIPSYRTDWLPQKDHAFIRDRYVKVADDFWVLGRVLRPGEDTFEVYHPGRYRICRLDSSNLYLTYPDGLSGWSQPQDEPVLQGTIDGRPLTGSPVALKMGLHCLKCTCQSPLAVVWVGPRLNRLPRLGRGDHLFLFYNWY